MSAQSRQAQALVAPFQKRPSLHVPDTDGAFDVGCERQARLYRMSLQNCDDALVASQDVYPVARVGIPHEDCVACGCYDLQPGAVAFQDPSPLPRSAVRQARQVLGSQKRVGTQLHTWAWAARTCLQGTRQVVNKFRVCSIMLAWYALPLQCHPRLLQAASMYTPRAVQAGALQHSLRAAATSSS